jgi:hypothetical protein
MGNERQNDVSSFALDKTSNPSDKANMANRANLFHDSYGSCPVSPGQLTFASADFAQNFWTTDFSSKLCTQSDAALNQVFDEEGDFTKLKAYKADDDATVKSLLASHKKGDHWQSGDSSYFIDNSGDLITKDKQGVHFLSADGLRYDGSHGEGVLTHNGESVVRKGDKYFKQYPDGEQFEITDPKDKEAIIKIEGLVFEQRNAALRKMDRADLVDAMHQGSRIVQGNDGVAVYRVDGDQNVIAKNTNDHGAFVYLKRSGDLYHIHDGQIYRMNRDDHTETLVSDGQLPSNFKRNVDGTISVNTVTIGKDDKLSDSDQQVQMRDKGNRVTAHTGKGDVTASVVQGQEQIQTADHRYSFDTAAAGGAGTFSVFNNNQMLDSNYDFSTNYFCTDGVCFTPQGCRFDDDLLLGNDNSVTDSFLNIFSGDNYNDHDYDDYITGAEIDTQPEIQDAKSDMSAALADVANARGSASDLAELEADLVTLDLAGGAQGLTEEAKAKINLQKGAVLSAIGVLNLTMSASQNILSATGIQDSGLTTESLALGGDANSVDRVLRKHGLKLSEGSNSAT